MKHLLVLLSLSLGLVTPVKADDYYKVTVTRKSANLYVIDGTNTYVKTKYCYEYAYSEEAIVRWGGKYSYNNKLIFVDSETSCDIETLLTEK